MTGLVSCIMPTCDRRPFVGQAVRYFERQDYADRELIVIDDGLDPIRDLLPDDSRIRYERVTPRQPLGDKRNRACELARGALVAHWDDDDWMADWRLTYQVDALERGGDAPLCGLSTLRFYDVRDRRAWEYRYPPRFAGRPWVAGGTLCYRRSLAQAYPFRSVTDGEDTRFVWSVPPSAVRALADPSFYVALVHARNTSPKRTRDSRWRPYSSDALRRDMGADLAFYDALPC